MFLTVVGCQSTEAKTFVLEDDDQTGEPVMLCKGVLPEHFLQLSFM